MPHGKYAAPRILDEVALRAAVRVIEAGRQVQLVRNDKYYAAAWGKTRLDRISVLVIPDPQTANAEVSAGKVDFLWNIQPDQMIQLKTAANVDTVTGPSVSISFWRPVKNGWQAEQISRCSSGLVDRVFQVAPQAHRASSANSPRR